MYKPNLNMPLAIPYNERGMAGFTHTNTNSEDQRKINCFYEVTKSALTGQGKLDLTKRPGVSVDGNSYGVSAQAAYLIITKPLGSMADNSNTPWVISVNGSDITASDSASTSVVFSSGAGYVPCFIDKTLLSNKETIVFQARKADFTSAHRTFYSDSAVASFVEITDGDFTGLTHKGKMEHMDGYAFILESTNKIYNSDLNSLAAWTATSFISKQIRQDAPIGLARLNNQILAFGDETVEAFYNAGNATGSPLLPIRQLHQKVGLVPTTFGTGTHYYCTVENRLYFVGRASGGQRSLGVFSYNGSVFEKVSPSFIDKILGEGSIFSVSSFGFAGQKAVAISLVVTNSATPRWLMFFPEWRDWFEWNSTVFTPVNSSQFFIGATPNQHKMYVFNTSSDNWQDAGTSFTMRTQLNLPQDGHQRKRMAEFGVLADTARASNMLSVEFSDDDYISFINIGAIDLARDIKTLNRGGSYRKRAVRLSSTNALETRLHAFIARIE